MKSTSPGAPFSGIKQTSYILRDGIKQTSYILRDLEVETDYVVIVTATNECGIESPSSEEITVRVDGQGTMYIYVHA